jgi:alkylation response protein AidB-like acyl-CoA dehydrogenase
MDLTFNEQEAAFRDEVRAWFAANDPGPEPQHDEDAHYAWRRAFQRRLAADGLAAVHWPKEYGGRAATLTESAIFFEELGRSGGPLPANVLGLLLAGPTIMTWGTDEQKDRYLEPILTGDEIWCQGFSEPDAGSDLASLRARAEDRGDHFVLSGQKTWVSWGQFARWCGVLARTHDAGPKHRGISMLIVDMRSPGVELRPMTQITGHAEFCELFLDDVVVPRANLLGELGDGWKIAMHTLGHERGTAALPRQVKLRTWLDRAVRLASERTVDGRRLIDDPGAQAALARALVGVEVLRHHAYRTVGEFLNGGAVGPDSSSVKLLMAEAEQRLAATVLDVLGPTLEHAEPDAAEEDGFWYETYLYSRAATIYGGTQQIQRNIIADRVLALPQE